MEGRCIDTVAIFVVTISFKWFTFTVSFINIAKARRYCKISTNRWWKSIGLAVEHLPTNHSKNRKWPSTTNQRIRKGQGEGELSFPGIWPTTRDAIERSSISHLLHSSNLSFMMTSMNWSDNPSGSWKSIF